MLSSVHQAVQTMDTGCCATGFHQCLSLSAETSAHSVFGIRSARRCEHIQVVQLERRMEVECDVVGNFSGISCGWCVHMWNECIMCASRCIFERFTKALCKPSHLLGRQGFEPVRPKQHPEDRKRLLGAGTPLFAQFLLFLRAPLNAALYALTSRVLRLHMPLRPSRHHDTFVTERTTCR